jgi:hypothetical protein
LLSGTPAGLLQSLVSSSFLCNAFRAACIQHDGKLAEGLCGPVTCCSSGPSGFDQYTSAARFQNQKGEYFFMSRRSLPLFLAIIALTTLSVSVWAKNESGDTITTNLKLTATTSVGTTKLAPGEYRVIADASKAKFELGNKVVAEVPCTLKDFSTKINQTTFVIDHDQLTEIQVSGKTKAIEFSSGQ